MAEHDGPESTWQDAIGLVGIALAITGLWDIPPSAQLVCFVACAGCLLISFFNQESWPVWVRWLLSVPAVVLIAFMSWSAIKRL